MMSIKKCFFISLLLMMANSLCAQVFTPKWESCFGGTKWDEGTGIIYADSSYWIVGNTNSNNGDISYNHGTYDFWFLNVDINGNLISEKTYGGSYADGGFTDIKKLNDSVFYVIGGTNSSDGDVQTNQWPESLGNLWIIN